VLGYGEGQELESGRYAWVGLRAEKGGVRGRSSPACYNTSQGRWSLCGDGAPAAFFRRDARVRIRGSHPWNFFVYALGQWVRCPMESERYGSQSQLGD